MVRDVSRGSDGAYPDSLTAIGGTLFFSLMTVSTATELWVSDGTRSGASLVRNIRKAWSSYPWSGHGCGADIVLHRRGMD